MNERILIFDGTNTFLRNYAVNPTMDVNGVACGGLVGSIRTVKFMLREVAASRVFFVWDAEGGSRKRRGIFSEYKAGRRVRLNRDFDEMSIDESRQNIEWQMAKTKEFLKLLGVTQVEVGDIEADDAIGYLCGYFESTPKVVVSTDRDMWQLVGPTTAVYWPTKQVYITNGTFKTFTECAPWNYVLMRAMEGHADASDNIKGIKGLGEKTILKIFPELKDMPISLDALLDQTRHLLQLEAEGKRKLRPTEKRWFKVLLENQDIVRRNIELMQLSSPIISAASAAIIRNAAESKPTFQFTSFRLGLMNNNIQLTDTDILTVFKAYQTRYQQNASR